MFVQHEPRLCDFILWIPLTGWLCSLIHDPRCLRFMIRFAMCYTSILDFHSRKSNLQLYLIIGARRPDVLRFQRAMHKAVYA